MPLDPIDQQYDRLQVSKVNQAVWAHCTGMCQHGRTLQAGHPQKKTHTDTELPWLEKHVSGFEQAGLSAFALLN